MGAMLPSSEACSREHHSFWNHQERNGKKRRRHASGNSIYSRSMAPVRGTLEPCHRPRKKLLISLDNFVFSIIITLVNPLALGMVPTGNTGGSQAN
jgi:hypothetical protein